MDKTIVEEQVKVKDPGPSENLMARILIKVHPEGQWTIHNDLNDEPFNSEALCDLFFKISQQMEEDQMAERVLKRLQQKLGGL